jgi:hypothetical protein
MYPALRLLQGSMIQQTLDVRRLMFDVGRQEEEEQIEGEAGSDPNV